MQFLTHYFQTFSVSSSLSMRDKVNVIKTKITFLRILIFRLEVFVGDDKMKY